MHFKHRLILVIFGFIALALLIIWVRNLPPRAPEFKKSSSTIYTYEAKNKNFQSGIGIKDKSPIVSFSVANDKNITFLYQSSGENQPSISSRGKNLTFTEIEKNIDLKYQTLPTGIKEEIVLKEARQKEKEANVFIFGANFQGAYPKEMIKGMAAPVFYDNNGNYLFHFERPFAVDAKGNRTDSISLQIEDKASSKIPDVKKDDAGETPYLIRLTVDSDWLDSPDRSYPIIIDPTIVHDTSSEFAVGALNRIKDTGSGASPVLESYYQEMMEDINTVGLWHMNEASGAVYDFSNNGNTLSQVSTSVVSGIIGNARNFTGTSYLRCNDANCGGIGELDVGTSPWTIEAWIKTSASATTQSIVSKATTGDLAYQLVMVNGILYANVTNTAGTWDAQRVGTTNIADGNWHHVAMVFVGSTNLDIYVDGKIDNSTTLTGTIPSMIRDSATFFYISTYDGTNQPFSGTIDEVRVSRMARTPEEIAAAASRRQSATFTSNVIDLTGVNSWNSLTWSELGVSTGDGETLKNTANLVTQWNFNSNSGTTTANDSGSCGASCNGTLNNFIFTSSQDQDNSAAVATGGTITYSGGYTIHTFTGNGTFSPSINMNVDILVVAGGGGGANTGSGGGGGGVVYNTNYAMTVGGYSITVGNGGPGGATTAAPGTKGSNSIVTNSLTTITAEGGGAGISHGGSAGGNGGSGGGGPIKTAAPAATGGTASQGYAGGAGFVDAGWVGGSGGGGGAGGVGSAGTNAAGSGNGGPGISNSITGTATFYAAGGGGGEVNGTYVGAGGSSIGGNAVLNAAGGNGATNTGSGGAGGSYNGGVYTNGGAGGSGIVIIRYPTRPSGWTANNKKWGSGALLFDGLDDYVNIPDNNALSFGNAGTDTPFSISTWVKPSYLAGTSDGNWIISKRDAGSGDEYQLVFWQKQISTAVFTSNGNYIGQVTNKSWDPGNWYHIVMTYDGSKTTGGIKIYVNGKLEPTTATTGGTYTGMNNSANPVLIGKASWNSGLEFDGVIDSTQIFSRVLTSSEILSNYNAGQIELQTRVGETTNADDGSWEEWRPLTTEEVLDSLDAYSPAGCSGGTSIDGGRIFMFTSSGTFTCTGSGTVEVLVVAGGGGGGTNMGGGGGGGGVIHNKLYSVAANTPITVTVGNGGAGAPAGVAAAHPTAPASNGQNSVFGSLTAIGGGAGGTSPNSTGIANGSNGGSGGGASGYNSDSSAPGAHPGGTGVAGQGFRGGAQGNAYYSGGGGGAGGAGADGNNKANGGIGYYSDILGTGYYWGGGGGGAGYSIAGGNGGYGGGGGGAGGTTIGGNGYNNGEAGGGGCTVCWTNMPGGNAGANTGGGGGGGGHFYSNNKGGDGGKGIVIVKLSPLLKDTVVKTEGTGSQKLAPKTSNTDDSVVGLWHLDETGGNGAYLKNSSSFPTYNIFSYTGADQTYTVPANINSVKIKMWGGGGGGGNLGGWSYGFPGGGGGYTTADLAVTPGQNLTVMVGGGGLNGSTANTNPSYGGGARSCNTGTDCRYGGQGGGRSAIRISGVDYITAGGGGGGGSSRVTTGEEGGHGGATGSAGLSATAAAGGKGATAIAGGAGGTGTSANGSAGTQYAGGNPASNSYGGGGGGGYYGGGGGGYGEPNDMGGGGGGSGYIGGAGVSNGETRGGGSPTVVGGGYIQANPNDPYNGGFGAGGAAATNGANGRVIIIENNGPTNHGTPIGTTPTDGVSGKARSFNGTTDYVQLSANGLNSQTFTAEAWIKVPGNPSSGNRYINYGSLGSNNGGFIMGIDTSGLIRSYLDSGCNATWGLLNSTISVADNKWHHTAMTYDGTTRSIYIDGVLNNSNTYGYCANPSSPTLQIGKATYGSTEYFTGSIDEVRISNVARTADEIAESYRMGRDQYINETINSTDLSGKTTIPFSIAADKPGTYLTTTIGESAFANYQPDSNTAGLWHMDEQTGNNAYIRNSGSSSNHGTPTGTTFVQGKIGKARKLNGTSDYITIPENDSLDPANITLEAWIYPTALQNGNFINKGDNSGYRFRVTTDGSLQLLDRGATNSLRTTANIVSINKWYYVTATGDSSGLKIYVNGQLVAANNSAYGSPNTSTDLVLGRFAGASEYFSGIIDEVRISNIARTADEIRQAYESGLRSHSVTIDFAAILESSDIIDDINDTSFTIDSRGFGGSNKGSNLYVGDKIIVKENYDGVEYVAQGNVSSINSSTGAVTVSSWDSGSTFSNVGFTPLANVFKWQKEYWNITEPLDSHLNTSTNLSLRITNGNEGRTIWLDDIKSAGDYLTNPAGSTITSSTSNRYFQYRAIFNSSNEFVSPTLSNVTLDYVANAIPTTPTLVSPSNGALDRNLTFGFVTSTTDTDGDYLRYKIELCTNVGMTTGCQTFDQTSSQTGWSNQNAQSNTAYASGSQATYTLQSNLAVNTTYYWRSYAIDPAGTNIWSATQGSPYSFTTSTYPDAPTSLLTEGLTNPTAIIDQTPEFSAIHSDSNGDDSIYYEIEVNNASDFSGVVMWDSGKQSMTASSSGMRSQDFSYAGTTLPFDGGTYYWRIRFWDIFDLISPWSASANFSMNNIPNAPTLDLPLNGNTNTYFRPTLMTTAKDIDGDYLRYKIELCTNVGMTTGCQTFDQTSSQTGWSNQNAQSNTAYTSESRSSYTLQSDLLPNTTYYWRSYAIDPGGSNSWSATQDTPRSFVTLSAPLAASSCFIRESIRDTQLAIVWTDNATNENFYEVQRSVDGGSWVTFQTNLPANTTSIIDNTVNNGHTYKYRIAPYFIGPFYSSWCEASNLNLGLGLFNLGGINAAGINFN